MRTASMFLKLMFISIFVLGFTKSDQNHIGKISFILGRSNEVEILKNGLTNWTSARLYSKLYNGDQIKTVKEARCELRMTDKSIIRIGEKSKFTVNQQPRETKKKSWLSFGKIWLNIKKMGKKQKFYVKTPTAVCSVRGTIFRVETDSSTKIAVYDGEVDVGPKWMVDEKSTQQQVKPTKSLMPVEVPGPSEIPPPFEVSLEQWIRIVKGYQIIVRDDGKFAKTKIDSTEEEKIDWVMWNKERDKTIE